MIPFGKSPSPRNAQTNSITFLVLGLLTFVSGAVTADNDDYLGGAAKTVVFVYDAGTKPCEPPAPNTVLYPDGTGFVVGLRPKGVDARDDQVPMFKFLVSAQHVIGNRSSVTLRLNRTGGAGFGCYPVELVRSGKNQNVFLPDRPEIDLAVVSLGDLPGTDPAVFDFSLLIDKPMMSSLEVREGTDIFTVGYLYGYSGNQQNHPITRFGKIAQLSDESWFNSPRNHVEKAYLVELQNVPGLSGAPVMLLSPQVRIGKSGQLEFRKVPPYVVGIVKGLLKMPPTIGGSQGVAAIEPGEHLREVFQTIISLFKARGIDIETQAIPEVSQTP